MKTSRLFRTPMLGIVIFALSAIASIVGWQIGVDIWINSFAIFGLAAGLLQIVCALRDNSTEYSDFELIKQHRVRK